VLDDEIGEALVHRLVDIPAIDVERELVDAVVAERPDDAIADVLVVDELLVLRQLNRDDMEVAELLVELLELIRGEIGEVAGPADPESAGALMRDAEAGREAAGAGKDDGALALDCDGDGEAVGDEEEARGHGTAGMGMGVRSGSGNGISKLLWEWKS
jgi:hypothetical protein